MLLQFYSVKIKSIGPIAQFHPEDDRPLAEVRANMHNVYFAKSLKNGKIYCGFTTKDPKIRIEEHNEGNTQWTRNNRPLKLVYFETFICKEDGLKREAFFKTGIGKKIKKAIVKELDS